MNNPLHDIIYDKVVKPALNGITRECDGVITYVQYTEQTVDVLWRDHQGGTITSRNVSMPKDGDGVYRQSVKIGDRVKIGFVNGSHLAPYISTIYKEDSQASDYKTKNGAGMMKGINYIMGSD